MSTDRPPTIAPSAALHWSRVAPASSPWLHEEVARRMEERLQWIKLKPAAWVHWEAVRGGLAAHALLVQRYPAAQCYVLEEDERLRGAAEKALRPHWWQAARWRRPRPRFEAPPASGADMLWSNMSLHGAADPQALIGRWHRTLATDGFLMFSCLGPDTLRELRDLHAAQGWPPPGHEFTDMHDWGDMLVQAGFAEPVMDMERITLSFETPQRLLQELRELGRNLNPGRFAALRGKGWREKWLRAVAAQAGHGGPLTLSFEIIYGHALKAVPRLKLSAESALSLQDMQAMLQAAKSRA